MDFRLTRSMPIQPVIEAIKAACEKSKLGVKITIAAIKPKYTRQEEKSLHWLLARWIDADPGLTVSLEQLKEDVCKALYGVVRQTSFGGQESFIAARRTTRRWDFRAGAYVDEPLTVDEYAELIDYIYRLASEDGITLPELDRSKAA